VEGWALRARRSSINSEDCAPDSDVELVLLSPAVICSMQPTSPLAIRATASAAGCLGAGQSRGDLEGICDVLEEVFVLVQMTGRYGKVKSVVECTEEKSVHRLAPPAVR
jgi:hypothetical protein